MKKVLVRPWTTLQLALLAILLETDGQVTLDQLVNTLYKTAHKRKPKSSPRKAITGLVRATSAKLSPLQAWIERITPLGSGHAAVYELKGAVAAVKSSVEEQS